MSKQPKFKDSSFKPVVVYDAAGYLRQLWLAVECVDEVVWYVVSDTTQPHLFIRGALIGQVGKPGSKARLIMSDKDPHELALRLKSHALKWGATSEAIRLLSQVCSIDEEEEKLIMAKLARKEELKEAAKETPVGGRKAKAGVAKANGGNGNAARMREAAEGKRAEFAAQRLTVLVKPSDTTLRGGRLAKLEHVYAAKPKKVGDVLGDTFEHEGKEIVIDTGALRGMEKREHIEIG